MQKLVEEFLKNNNGYLKKSAFKVAERLKLNYVTEPDIINEIKTIQKRINKEVKVNILEKTILERIKFPKAEIGHVGYQGNSKFKFAEIIKQENIEKENKEIALTYKDLAHNVLVIGDLHVPFEHKDYLEFCKEQYEKFNCNKVVFIGDIVDNCYSSFHPSDPDGYTAGQELDRAIDHLKLWYNAFPEAAVIVGNHDRLAYRKAFSGGISSRWIRNYNDVLEVPNWKFEETIDIDGVKYIHGEAGTARMKAKDISQSVVQGHLHSQAYIEWINNRVFGMQVGTGVNDNEYAFNYNKAGKESILSCGVVLEGKQPILIKM